MALPKEVRKKIEEYAPKPVNAISYVTGTEGDDIYVPGKNLELSSILDKVQKIPEKLKVFVAIAKQEDGSEETLRVIKDNEAYIFQKLNSKVSFLESVVEDKKAEYTINTREIAERGPHRFNFSQADIQEKVDGIAVGVLIGRYLIYNQDRDEIERSLNELVIGDKPKDYEIMLGINLGNFNVGCVTKNPIKTEAEKIYHATSNVLEGYDIETRAKVAVKLALDKVHHFEIVSFGSEISKPLKIARRETKIRPSTAQDLVCSIAKAVVPREDVDIVVDKAKHVLMCSKVEESNIMPHTAAAAAIYTVCRETDYARKISLPDLADLVGLSSNGNTIGKIYTEYMRHTLDPYC